jgi:hypothetical protein
MALIWLLSPLRQARRQRTLLDRRAPASIELFGGRTSI